MKSITQYITEFVNINNIKIFKYRPKTTGELIKAIETELKEGNTDLNCIDTTDITNMSNLFSFYSGIRLDKKQQQKLNISSWNTSNVKDMEGMFHNNKYINCDVSKWNVYNVEIMKGMFSGCEKFNSDVSNWNVSNVKDMQGMFFGCKHFNKDVSNWDVSNVKTFQYMFKDCERLNCDFSKWKIQDNAILIGMYPL